MAGVFQRFGSNPGGAGPLVLVVASTVPTGNSVTITDWGATLGVGGADTLLQLQLSTDNFAGSIVEVSRIEMPVAGTISKTLGAPIRVQAGQSVRVLASQGTPGEMSAEVLGQTSAGDIADI